MYERFTDRARKVMQLANQEAQRFNHEYIGTEHILLGLVKEGSGVAANVLKNLDIDLRKIRLEVEKIVQHGPGGEQVVMGRLPHTPRAKKVIEYSIEEARNLNHNYVGTEHLLLGLLREQEGVAAQVLMNLGLKLEDVREEVLNLLGHNMPNESEGGREGGERGGSSERTSRGKSKTPALDSFGRDLTELARQGKLDPVIGRTAEIERVIQILSRRQKNNPVLLGEAGVGKTAIVEGLAQMVVDGNIPELLRDKRIVVLDLAMMVAGTKYRGQFEERIKAVMNEVRRAKNTMLFIDELHTLVGAGGAEGAIDASNVLKPALARGEIQCIGATTLDEYRKYIEKDAALARRFQAIIVNPPSMAETVEILKGLRDRYEAHHRVQITDSALKAAVELSERYITGHCLPDKAIDVIDEAGARVRLKGMTRPPDLKELDEKIDKLNQEKEAAVMDQDFERAAALRDQAEKLRKQKETQQKEWREKAKETDGVVDEEIVAEVVSKMTGVPLKKVGEDETKRLLNMEAELHGTVISQNEAIHALAKAVRKSRSGMKDPKRPIGSFIFAGPTGVGKTLLAKQLAKFMFGDENNIVQLDMSEYMEKHNVSRLVGAPPGYIGYEEGGQLTEKIRRKPYSVVLLDEIEKAHEDVWNMLLQIMEEGRLTDNVGRTIDFKNTILIMTTNIGAKDIVGRADMTSAYHTGRKKDTEVDYQDLKKKVQGHLEKEFKPEFLNRLDDIIVFRRLTKFDLKEIVDMELAKVSKRLKEKGLTLALPDPAYVRVPELVSWLEGKGVEFKAERDGKPVDAATAEIKPDVTTVQRWLRDKEVDLDLRDGSFGGDLPGDYEDAKKWVEARLRSAGVTAKVRMEEMPVSLGAVKAWLEGKRDQLKADLGAFLDRHSGGLTYGQLAAFLREKNVKIDLALAPIERRQWWDWFQAQGVTADNANAVQALDQLPTTHRAALEAIQNNGDLMGKVRTELGFKSEDRSEELPVSAEKVRAWLVKKLDALNPDDRTFPRALHPAKELIIEKGSSTDYGARPLRRAVEQYLEDPLAEELLKGSFEGSDTLAVKVVEEAGEQKLGFAPAAPSSQQAPAPVAAGQQ